MLLGVLKPGTSVIGPDEPIRRPRSYTGKIAYEGELGIVIGRRCKDVAASEAQSFIFGYTCVNDVTAAELLNENPDFAQWCRSKGCDTFGCLGPVITTDLDWPHARVVTKVDGAERQNYPLSDMIMPPAELVSRLSHDMTLLPGDVIACGTSVGVGSIKDGATVEVRIDGIGSLVNALTPLSTTGIEEPAMSEPRRPTAERALLLQMFHAAIASAQPTVCIPPHLPAPPRGRLIVIGAGKASAAMARAVEQHWPGPLSGLVVTASYGYAVPCERIEIVQAAHPVPDAAGMHAAQQMLERVQEV